MVGHAHRQSKEAVEIPRAPVARKRENMGKGANRDILIVGGGIAGMQAALLLAEKDYRVVVLESAPAIGGFFPLLDRTFPTNSCGVCFMTPKPPSYCPIYESEFHENIELLTNCELKRLKGEVGNFEVTYVKRPRYVGIAKCTLCDRCAEVCPVETDREFGAGVEKQKAIYLPFAQAIPRCYVIDEEACTKCGECVKACTSGAIDLEEKPVEKRLNVGAIILGFGFEAFRAQRKGEYGFGRYKNVVSSVQYERMLSFSGPGNGLPQRPSDGKNPKKVAFIQCVGSRDPSCGQGYCSSICCMCATKQAMVSKDRDKDLEATIFYMDIRPMGKGYERYYDRARKEYEIRYIRSAVSTVRELQQTKRLLIGYGLDDGTLKEEEFDMVVLSVGLTPPAGIKEVAQRLGVSLNEFGFCLTEEFIPTQTSVAGVYVAGAFREPRDIPETVVEAAAAAADVSKAVGESGPQKRVEAPREAREASEEEALRIGVFLCERNGMLAEGLAVEEIVAEVGEDPAVDHVERADVTSLKDGAEAIGAQIDAHQMNRTLLAGYGTVSLSRALARRCDAVSAGRCLVEYTNIGEQCANVHSDDPVAATRKAIGLIRAGLRKVTMASRGERTTRPLYSRVLVVGGGIAGLSCSLSLADQGMEVTLVEKGHELGGTARQAYYTLKGSDIQALVEELVSRAEAEPKIEILTGAQLESLEGIWGSYRSFLSTGEEKREVLHGAVVFATGGSEVEPEEYLFGENDNVITQRKFEGMLATGDPKATDAKTVVMIQCVGSREEGRPYCSRVCCTQAVKNALKLEDLNADATIVILYRDVRTYGFYETYYHRARERGVLFVRYDPANKPKVSAAESGLRVNFFDPVVGEAIDLDSDLVVLSVGMRANEDNRRLAEIAGLQLDEDGFFAAANPKSAPLDSLHRGKYFCGLCHSPNHIEDAISQGKAAAARASALLGSGEAELAPNLAFVNERRCSGCGLCVTACPYQARVINKTTNRAEVIEELCKGCGTCVISCPNGASQQYNFERSTIMDVLDEVMV